MNRVNYIGTAWLFATLLALTGCQGEGDDNMSPSDSDVLPSDGVMRFSMESSQTKVGVTTATLTEFGIFVVSENSEHNDDPFDYPYSYENVKVSLPEGEWVAAESLVWESEDIEVTISAYSPYISDYTSFSVQTDQSTEAGLIASDLISASEDVTPSNPRTSNDIYYNTENKSVVVDMEHILTSFSVTLTLKAEDFTLTSNPISSVTLTGTCITAEFDYEDAEVDDESNVQDIKLYASSYTIASDGSTATAVYEGIVIPQTVDEGDLGLTVIDVDGRGYRWTSSDDATFHHGYHAPLELTIEK